MKPENDDRKPIEVLYDIEQAVKGAASENPLEQLEPRMTPEPGSTKYRILEEISNRGPLMAKEIESVKQTSVTRTLTALYRMFALNRDKSRGGKYEYSLSPLGAKVVDNGQTQINGNGDGKDPWHKTDLSESEYYALKVVSDAIDAPRSKDIDEKFINLAPVGQTSEGPTCTPYLSKVYQRGYLDRTPNQPYRYWLTEKGKEVLED